MVDMELFLGDLIDTGAEQAANLWDTPDFGIEGWGYDDDLSTSDVQQATGAGEVIMGLDLSSQSPAESKIEFCPPLLAGKAYCCNGQVLPDGSRTGCIECMFVYLNYLGYK